ncbi:hypothetical protein BpHYR1_006032 [Brachionus plicatilis]|uniref:Uncharacterized protein n=1 Tax=Brachionus plicatilis TaxID=10195 RepID=A0A3M7PXR3_BRAPC|nr:hypothetical protein BpHYR1_006032 [Brachionus plicatilis]
MATRARAEPKRKGGPVVFAELPSTTDSEDPLEFSFRFTLNIQNKKPYIAGPMPLHRPRIPVTIPCDTPCWST